MLAILYIILDTMYFIFMCVAWLAKSKLYIEDEDIAFKDLFNLCDLGLVIFPTALFGVILAIFMSFLFNIEELLDGERGIFKRLFK